jgi:hypothetical protein
VGERPQLEIPDYALDMHTRRGRQHGRGARRFYAEGPVVSPVADVHDPYLEDAIRIDEHAENKRRPQTELFDDERVFQASCLSPGYGSDGTRTRALPP